MRAGKPFPILLILLIVLLLALLLAVAPAWAQNEVKSFTGLWKTTYGPMRLHQTGDKVDGAYQFQGVARVHGTLAKNTLTFQYEEPTGVQGEGEFVLAADGQSFMGKWREKGKTEWGNWTGTRQKARPGVTYLIVLEAHWESGLAEQEYSYGAMLRSFFQRVPTVEVRQRFFRSAADLKERCREVLFLAEPVVLYISSHGSPSGLFAEGQEIPPSVLGESLRDASNIKLLHLGACNLMEKDAPELLRKAVGGTASFPISGYAKAADWAGSAVIDFLYLDLILGRGLTPEAAAKTVRASISFAKETNTTDTVVPPADFRFSPAPMKK